MKEQVGRERDQIEKRHGHRCTDEAEPDSNRRQDDQPSRRGEIAEAGEGDWVVHYGLGSL